MLIHEIVHGVRARILLIALLLQSCLSFASAFALLLLFVLGSNLGHVILAANLILFVLIGMDGDQRDSIDRSSFDPLTRDACDVRAHIPMILCFCKTLITLV